VPSWSKDRTGAARMINARSETVLEKRSFQRPVASRRCLVPADGWYEWKPTPEGKRPHHMTRRDGAPLALAGLYEFCPRATPPHGW
jgi:putative SOS response-associated peptidase YedK